MSNTVNLAERFAHSEKFKKLFQDGMNLVEECATYLDGDGRKSAKELPRNSAMLYGTESMRMTTRLMQIASWLLLQRAANEGEMTRDQVLEEKTKIRMEPPSNISDNPAWETLPAEFLELIARSVTLQNRVTQLDRELYGDKPVERQEANNPVDEQIDLISTALGAKRNRN